MPDIVSAIYDVRQFDELSRQGTFVHRLHPGSKLLTVAAYTLLLVSFGKYDISPMLPFVFFPAYLFAAGGIPLKPLMKRLAYVEPMIIAIGLLNPLFDRGIVVVYGHEFSAGWIISASIILKGTLAVLTALLLLATTGMDGISLALRKLKVPRIFVLQLMMTYRYLLVLLEETARIIQAHSLRSLGHRNIGKKTWGPMLGQILIRTFDRAQRIYDAMRLRGFSGEYHIESKTAFGLTDALFTLGWCAFFILARRIDIPLWLGNILTGAR